ncbi:MAG: NAD-binding protein [Candidatus Marinimicrobia bacterium]|nr:NAD-binding protein [Candidatus Neomarinimicrobiota bacterium]MCH8023675.1 NAD-binding protein [Candidatus Neomarinimicrobiota bacterium]
MVTGLSLIRSLYRNQLLRIFAYILMAALVGGLGVLFLENRVGNAQIHNIPEALWWAIVTMTTVGYGDYIPSGGSSRVLAVLIMFVGISLTSFLTGTIASVIVSRRLRANQGLLQIKVKDHIIICGWHHKMESLLDAFFAIENDDSHFVLINEEAEERMQALKNSYGYTRLKYIRGEFTNENILRQANLEKARAVILLTTELPTGGTSDEKTILATLTIKNMNPDIRVVAYVNDQAAISPLKRAQADSVVLADNFGSFMIVSHVMHPGIPQTANELLDSQSPHHFKRVAIEAQYVGRTFSELYSHFRKAHGWITIGLFTEEEQADFSSFLSADTSQLDAFIERKLREAGKGIGEGQSIAVMVNPPDDHVIQEGEGAIVIP